MKIPESETLATTPIVSATGGARGAIAVGAVGAAVAAPADGAAALDAAAAVVGATAGGAVVAAARGGAVAGDEAGAAQAALAATVVSARSKAIRPLAIANLLSAGDCHPRLSGTIVRALGC